MVNFFGNWIGTLRMEKKDITTKETEKWFFLITKGSADQWINWFAGGILAVGPLTRAGGEISNTIGRYLIPIKLLSYVVVINVEFYSLVLGINVEDK
jgi:hypothetical protein